MSAIERQPSAPIALPNPQPTQERQPLGPQSPAFVVTPKVANFRDYKTARNHFSVSAQPTVDELARMQSSAKRICLIDCRQETHYYVHKKEHDDHGINITYHNGDNDHNRGKKSHEVASTTHSLLTQITTEGKVVVFREYGKSKQFDTNNNKSKQCFVTQRFELQVHETAHRLFTPSQLAEHMEYKYLHVPMTDHDALSFLENVDAMKDAILHAQQTHSRIHFHCLGGVGRSVMSFLMGIIMDEAKDKSMEDIFKEFKAENGFKSEVKKIKKMKSFLSHFYDYCKNSDITKVTWTEWMQKNNITMDQLNPKKKPPAPAPQANQQKDEDAKPILDLSDIVWDAKRTVESPKFRTYFHLCDDAKMRTSEKKAIDQNSIRATVEIDKGIITKFIFKGVAEDKQKTFLKWFDDKGVVTSKISVKSDEF